MSDSDTSADAYLFRCYCDAFEELAKGACVNRRLVLPMLYVYRHALELGLKCIIRESESKDPPKIHSLRKLWQRAKDCIEEKLGRKEIELGSLSLIEKAIDFIGDVDISSETFRYSRSKREERHPWPREPRNWNDYWPLLQEAHFWLNGTILQIQDRRIDEDDFAIDPE